MDLCNNKDFWAGLMLIGIGAAAMWLARDYAFGTSLRMGPGYFPTVLGGVLIVFGVILLGRALRNAERIVRGWSVRALILLPLSLLLFGVLVERAGFVPALLVLVVGSAAAGSEFKLGEVAALAGALILFSIGVFIWGLGLPYPLVAGF
jgi:hypothetical protein